MNPLKSIPMTVGLGFILAIIISLSLNHGDPANSLWSLATWLHDLKKDLLLSLV